MFENRVLKKMIEPMSDEVRGDGESYTVRSFIICTHPQISLGRSNRGE
jgi:hypothetical protein